MNVRLGYVDRLRESYTENGDRRAFRAYVVVQIAVAAGQIAMGLTAIHLATGLLAR